MSAPIQCPNCGAHGVISERHICGTVANHPANLCNNGMTDEQPRRSLSEYTEELRAQIEIWEQLMPLSELEHISYVTAKRRLLTVEREINWRMGI